MEDAGRRAGDVRLVHSDVLAFSCVAELDASLQKRGLKREAATEQERDEVSAPVRCYVAHLGGQLAIAKDPIARQVGPQVSAGRGLRWFDAAGLHHFDDRAGLRVALAEEQEVEGQVSWQDDKVGLRVPHRQA